MCTSHTDAEPEPLVGWLKRATTAFDERTVVRRLTIQESVALQVALTYRAATGAGFPDDDVAVAALDAGERDPALRRVARMLAYTKVRPAHLPAVVNPLAAAA